MLKRWVTTASLSEGIGWLIKPFYYDDAASILEQRILRMMLHLGMLKLGEEPAGTVVMMTPWGCEAAVPKHLLR